MNRKLIRTTLAEVKEREAQHKDHPATDGVRVANASGTNSDGVTATRSTVTAAVTNGSTAMASMSGRKRAPAAETNAEVFYYKKQIESHTPMVIMLQDGEEIEGTIEWYDRSALKVNRKSAPNILLFKHNIKYMYKAEDRVQN